MSSDWKFENEVSVQELRKFVNTALDSNNANMRELVREWWEDIQSIAKKGDTIYYTGDSFMLNSLDQIVTVYPHNNVPFKAPKGFSINKYIDYFLAKGFEVEKIKNPLEHTYYLKISWKEEE